MVAARRHETPGPEIKDFVQDTVLSQGMSLYVTTLSTNTLLRKEHRGPKGKVGKIPRRPLCNNADNIGQ